MSDEQEDKIDRVLSLLEDHTKDLATIKRGVYGDPVNKVSGLIDTDRMQDEVLKDHQNQINELKEENKKRKWTLAGFSAAISITGGIIWHFVKDIFK
jgi:RNA binding exosome subunit